MKSKLKPTNDHILVRREEARDRSDGGILIPEVAKQQSCRGEVRAVGPGKLRDDGKRSPVSVVVGEVVLFGVYAGTEVQHDGEDYLLLSDHDILAVVMQPT